MSTLLSSLGRWSFRHPWRVLGAWLLLLLVAGLGALGLGKGFDDAFAIPGTESEEGLDQLARTFPEVAGTGAQFIVVAAEGDSVDDADYREPIEETLRELEAFDAMEAVTSPYDDLVEGLVADDGAAAIVQLQLSGEATAIDDEVTDAIADVVHGLAAELPGGSVTKLGGDLYAVDLPGLSLVELVGVAIALLVLIATFRSFVMAGLPLGVAIVGVGVSMLGIVAATGFATVSSTTPMLALMLGLAVGIDYALFIAARHQDQVRDGADPEDSAARATGTAGSAVVFAGVTVLIALVGLSFAQIPFLTTMGVAAAVSVAVAMAIAVTLTPAFLGFAKGRVIGRPRRTRPGRPERAGFARRWVTAVTKHPVVTTVAVVLGLGIVAIPAGQLQLALPNAGVLPQDSEARQAYDLTGEHFGEGFNGPLILTGTVITSTDPVGLMEDLGDEVAQIDGVAEVALTTPNATGDTGIVQVIPETGPSDPATSDLVRELRAHHGEWLDAYGIDVSVTGFTAVSIDISDRLSEALLPFGVFVVGLSFLLLMVVFRSVWVPLKAALGYLLSVLAAFGVVTAVFEWGWGADLLHVSREGPVIAFMPIIVMGVLFGLAMDYEVFLVSRMREDYVHAVRRSAATRDVAIEAIRSGYAASARVVTAAAVIMFAVFAAFVPEGDSNIKPIALALAVGIAVDAFLIRMTLVPAVMALLGTRAWWMPAWLARRLPSLDVEGEAVEREERLARWPEPGSTAQIAADDVVVRAGDREIARIPHARVAPGEAVVVTAPDPRAARAAVLALAGRLEAEGRLRVGGHLLPGRAAWVRAHAGLALLDGSPDPAASLRQALSGRPSLVLVDGIDAVAPQDRDALSDLLRDADAPLALVVSSARADDARSLISRAGWTGASVLDVAPLAAAAREEVTA
ncbi:MMPL family transporter [Microbacterium sp. gxy059]|uniref:MMPL family transporter n=1 Tax=Microbacterium sp. gxy059 TaxID=2957199 RepID=UPI003D98A3A8